MITITVLLQNGESYVEDCPSGPFAADGQKVASTIGQRGFFNRATLTFYPAHTIASVTVKEKASNEGQDHQP